MKRNRNYGIFSFKGCRARFSEWECRKNDYFNNGKERREIYLTVQTVTGAFKNIKYILYKQN